MNETVVLAELDPFTGRLGRHLWSCGCLFDDDGPILCPRHLGEVRRTTA